MAERCKLCGAPLDNDGRCVSVLCLRAQVARLEADKAALAAALRPFAGYANQVSETVPDDAPYPYHPPMVVLRKARAALAGASPRG